MELYTLKINVTNQRLSFGENPPEIFSGDQSIDFVEFTFTDDTWNFPDIWAIFSRQKGPAYQIALDDNKVMIPAEVMQNRGYVYIGLMATDGENVQTSNVLQYSIGQGSTNVDAITPSASIYEQFLADLDAYQTAVADLDDIESRITTAEGNVSMIEQAVTDLNEQLGDINVDISTINGQITTIQNNIGTAQSDIVSIQNGINTLNGQVAGLDTAVGTLSNRVTALQSSVTSLEGRLTTVGNTLTDFEGRLTTAGTTLTNLEGSISDAENDIQTVQGDIETIQSDIEDIQTAIEQNNVVTDVTAEGISLVDNHIADLSFMCVTDTASGDVASFPDGSGVAMKKAEVSLEPIQDLHGYDKPWAGGGGKNLLNVGGRVNQTTAQVTYTSDDDYVILNGTKQGGGYANLSTLTIILPAGTYYAKAIAIGGTATNNISIYPFDGSADVVGNILDSEKSFTLPEEKTFYFRFAVWTDGTVFTNYKIGIVISKTSGIDKFYPYSNICPIDGYEDVGVSVRGVNMWDEEWEVGLLDASTGLPTTSSQYIRSKNFCECVPNTAYYAQITSPYLIRVFCYDADQNFIEALSAVGRGTFTTSANAHYFKIETWSSAYGTTYNNDISINYPSTDHDYHVYAGNDYTTDLGRTIYGGTIDLVSGRLVVDRAMTDMGSLSWYNNGVISGGAQYAVTIAGKKAGETNFICSAYETHSPSSVLGYICGRETTSVVACNATQTSLEDFKQAVSGQTICYELATPQTYQLTPQQIQTLVGTNNVWSEDGTIEVEYIANLKDYIDKKINA